MIIAVGLDVIELGRVEQVWNRHRNRFLERHFTEVEINYCLSKSNPLPSLAARFAAKEAFQKCWPESHGWKDVWVVREAQRPKLAFCEGIQSELERQQLRTHLSLTHSRDNAAAVVVLERVTGTAREAVPRGQT